MTRVKTERENLLKDRSTGAVLISNRTALAQYRRAKANTRLSAQRVATLEQQVADLRKDIDTILERLK